MTPDPEYDIAVSFAGEHREYVEQTVRLCQAQGLKVFYDKDKGNDWWGGSFLRAQRNIYSAQTRFFVPFLSQEYLSKPIPMDEFSSAMMTAVKRGDGYILPVLMDDTAIPADLLHPHIHYLRAKDNTPEQLAGHLREKVRGAEASGQSLQAIGVVVTKALGVRLPKIVPMSWSKYEQLDAVFEHVSTRFKEGAEQLRAQGLTCTVRGGDELISVRVEQSGRTISGIDVRKGGSMGDDRVTWSTNFQMSSGNSFNGWAKVVFDVESNSNLISISDFTSFNDNNDAGFTYEEFFNVLWGKVVDQVEASQR